MILEMQYDFEKGRTFLYPFSNYDIILVLCRGKQFSSATQFTLGGGVYGDMLLFPSTHSNPFFPHERSASGGWAML